MTFKQGNVKKTTDKLGRVTYRDRTTNRRLTTQERKQFLATAKANASKAGGGIGGGIRRIDKGGSRTPLNQRRYADKEGNPVPLTKVRDKIRALSKAQKKRAILKNDSLTKAVLTSQERTGRSFEETLDALSEALSDRALDEGAPIIKKVLSP